MQLELTLVTPERRQTLRHLRSVVFLSPQGEVGVLPGHAALVSLCACGIVRAFPEQANEPPHCFVVGAGSVRAIDNRLVLSTLRMCGVDELDASEAEARVAEAMLKLKSLDPYFDLEAHDEATRDAAFFGAVLELAGGQS